MYHLVESAFRVVDLGATLNLHTDHHERIIERRKSLPAHHKGLPERLKKEIRESFYILDTDHDGYIDRREVEALLWRIDPDSTHEEMDELLDAADLDDDKHYDVDEYLFLMFLKWNDQESVDDIKEAFKVFDTDNSGALSREEFAYILRRLGEPLTNEEVDAILDHFDRDGSGEIDFEEFAYVMTGPHLEDLSFDFKEGEKQAGAGLDFETLSPVKRMLQHRVSRTASVKTPQKPQQFSKPIKSEDLQKPLQEVMDMRRNNPKPASQPARQTTRPVDKHSTASRITEAYGMHPMTPRISARNHKSEETASIDSDNFSMCSEIIDQMNRKASITDHRNIEENHL